MEIYNWGFATKEPAGAHSTKQLETRPRLKHRKSPRFVTRATTLQILVFLEKNWKKAGPRRRAAGSRHAGSALPILFAASPRWESSIVNRFILPAA
jgi:hypothetical protein